jgi:hypothetical protein
MGSDIQRIIVCNGCARRHVERGAACDAFPNGIPASILVGNYDHRNAFDGDGGIRFALAPQYADFSEQINSAPSGALADALLAVYKATR